MASVASAAAALFVLMIVPAAAQNALLAEKGAALAQRWCAECHATGDDAQAKALTGAPSFKDIGGREAATPDNLRRALLGNHPVMPQFPVTNDEIEALSAYINTVSGRPPQSEKQIPDYPDNADASEAIGAGAKLVAINCAPCHATAGRGPSPVPDAPSLATLSEHYPVEYLAEALAEGILVGHPEVEMPEYVFETDEVTAIIAYLDSIQLQ